MAYKTFRNIVETGATFTPFLFDRISYMFTEAQQWG